MPKKQTKKSVPHKSVPHAGRPVTRVAEKKNDTSNPIAEHNTALLDGRGFIYYDNPEMPDEPIVLRYRIKIRDNMENPFPSLAWLMDRLGGLITMSRSEKAIIYYYATMNVKGQVYYPFVDDTGKSIGSVLLNNGRCEPPERMHAIRELWNELRPILGKGKG